MMMAMVMMAMTHLMVKNGGVFRGWTVLSTTTTIRINVHAASSSISHYLQLGESTTTQTALPVVSLLHCSISPARYLPRPVDLHAMRRRNTSLSYELDVTRCCDMDRRVVCTWYRQRVSPL